MSILESFREAGHLAAIGNFDGASDRCERLLAEMMGLAPENATALRGDDFFAIACDLTDLLRWNRRYDDAIELQHHLARLLPDQARTCRIAAATLMIEAGDIKSGFAELIIEARALGFAEGRLLLASSHSWLKDYEAATIPLRDLCNADDALPQERAAAFLLLFRVLGKQNKVTEAIAAWQMAVSLDVAIGATIPELIRMLVYWYHYDRALDMIQQDTVEVRRSFYITLIARKKGKVPARSDWDWVRDHAPTDLTLGHDEYADAALRNIEPSLAIAALMPEIEQGKLSFRPLFLTGLAFAQQRELNRATWALDRALRLADAERPRHTRSGPGNALIFDAESRITYGEIPIDADIRAHLDRYFMPTNSTY